VAPLGRFAAASLAARSWRDQGSLQKEIGFLGIKSSPPLWRSGRKRLGRFIHALKGDLLRVSYFETIEDSRRS
jgi:hypothetical protein